MLGMCMQKVLTPKNLQSGDNLSLYRWVHKQACCQVNANPPQEMAYTLLNMTSHLKQISFLRARIARLQSRHVWKCRQTHFISLSVATLWIWCARWFSQVVCGRLRAVSGLWLSAPCPSPVNYTKNSNCLSGLSSSAFGEYTLADTKQVFTQEMKLLSAPLQSDDTLRPVSLLFYFI